ncbi:hypothetical protein ACGFS9_06870 [Streptomyces sp. NPDC048566]|uniref:hypothetical protein n=1 Tax=Streptomyces sp. NPDC048566 TaxID=3365569 RepID=UPI0037242C9E
MTAFGRAFGVSAGAYTTAPVSGRRINPAVTIGLLPGGPTGYAIDPVSDLGPRPTPAPPPLPGEGTSGGNRSRTPVVGPIAGAAIGAAIHTAAFRRARSS